MAKNLRTSIKQSIKASSKAGVTGGGIFSLAPLDLRFAQLKTLDPRITFTRASTGTFVGSNGLIQTAASGAARFDHNPTTGESLGLLVEESRTNLLLNSATLSTQSATVTAVSTTLSFYGTGTVTLTGASTAGPLVGTGTNNRVSLTFTPTAGSLTLTVSGSVTNAQLEAGSFPTSYIATTGATATRAADVASMTGTNFSSWYNETGGTVFFNAVSAPVNNIAQFLYSISNGTTSEWILSRRNTSGFIATGINDNGVSQGEISSVAIAGAASYKAAYAYALNNLGQSVNGATAGAVASATLPTVTRLDIGQNFSGSQLLNGTIKRLTYWPVRLPNTTLQAITTP
jgi:hypothetical protein